MNFLTRVDRWDPFEELTMLRNRMDRLWSRVTDSEGGAAEWSPASDVVEKKNEIVISAELPGIDEKNVDVQIADGVLTIKGERKLEKESEEQGYTRVERSYGTFFRSFTLPADVEPQKISASLANGLLEVHLPKKEGALPRTVKIEVKKTLKSVA